MVLVPPLNRLMIGFESETGLAKFGVLVAKMLLCPGITGKTSKNESRMHFLLNFPKIIGFVGNTRCFYPGSMAEKEVPSFVPHFVNVTAKVQTRDNSDPQSDWSFGL